MQFDTYTSVLLESNAANETLLPLDGKHRLAALRDLDILDADAPVERNFQMLTELANKLLDTPVSLISLVTDDRQFFVSSDGLKEPWSTRRQTPLSHSFCQHVVGRNEPLVISNSSEHPLVCENLAIEELGVAAYLGVPLVYDDQVLGSFCVVDGTPRDWTRNDLDSLYKIASLAVAELASRKAAKQTQFEFESRLRLSQKMEALGQLTTGVAHDFRNILWAIQLSSDLLSKNGDNSSMAKVYADQIHTAVDAARGVVGQLLNWSRPGEYAATEVSLTQIVSQALPLLRTTLSPSAELLFDSTGDGRIFADRNQIHQMLLALCSNADHAMGIDGGELSISVETKRLKQEAASEFGLEAGSYVELCVSDQGCGIQPELLHRIHDPYFTTKSVGEGSGLGLWTVFGIVRRHDGQIKVDSVPNSGTTFRMLFPQSTAVESSTPDSTAIETDEGAKTKQVLAVVEDEDFANSLQDRLASNGVATVTFDDSPSAIEYFIRDPSSVDLLVTDEAMPILPGHELVQRCKLMKPSLPTVVCVKQGVDLSEPVSIADISLTGTDCDELANVVNQLLRQAQAGEPA